MSTKREEDVKVNIVIKSLKDKSKETGIPFGVLRTSYVACNEDIDKAVEYSFSTYSEYLIDGKQLWTLSDVCKHLNIPRITLDEFTRGRGLGKGIEAYRQYKKHISESKAENMHEYSYTQRPEFSLVYAGRQYTGFQALSEYLNCPEDKLRELYSTVRNGRDSKLKRLNFQYQLRDENKTIIRGVNGLARHFNTSTEEVFDIVAKFGHLGTLDMLDEFKEYIDDGYREFKSIQDISNKFNMKYDTVLMSIKRLGIYGAIENCEQKRRK